MNARPFNIYEFNLGDHRPITISLEVSVIISRLSDMISSKRRINWNVTANQLRYAEIVNDLIIKSDFRSIENSNLTENECARDLELLEDRMLSAEKILLRNLKVNKNRKYKHEKSKRFWCKLLKTLVYWRNKAHRAHKALAHSSFKALHSNLNKKIKQIIKKRRKYFIWLDRQDLIKKFLKHPNLFWKDINEKRGAKIKIDIDPGFLKERYEENFNSISQTANSKIIENKMNSIITEYADKVKRSKTKYTVSEEIIVEVLKNLKNNKKAGKNGVSNEMFKYARDTPISKILTNILEAMLNGGFCTENVNIGIIITIIKDANGCPKNIDNTRPITVSEVFSMVLEDLVMRDVSRKCVLNRHQFGFTAQSSCSHAVFTIKEIALHARANHKNAIALFLDFSKAFDKVNRTKLWYRLIKNCSPRYWLLLKNYYERMKMYVMKDDGSFTSAFTTSVGVKQGGKLSPFLYNLLVNSLLDIIENSNLTYRINNFSKGLLVYADDTNVICESLVNLKKVIVLIENFCSDFDITINVKKTKWMRLTPNYSLEEGHVEIGGNRVEEVKVFKFLGVILEANGLFSEHYKNRRKLFFGGISEINNFGFFSKELNTRMKSLLYTSLVRSKLLYGLETIFFKKKGSK
jgi:hypothetical protein